MDQALTFLSSITPKDVNTFLVVLGSAIGVSVVLQVVTHYGKLQDASRIVTSLLALLSYLGSLSVGVIQYGSLNPGLAGSKYFAWIMALAVTFHEFVGSSAYHGIVNFLSQVKSDAAFAAAYKSEHNITASVDGPITVTATTTPPADQHEFQLPQ